jgi:hypothetical protein
MSVTRCSWALNTSEERNVISGKEPSDLGVAGLALGRVVDAPPDLMPGVGHSLRACPPADLVERHAPALPDLDDERERVAEAGASTRSKEFIVSFGGYTLGFSRRGDPERDARRVDELGPGRRP